MQLNTTTVAEGTTALQTSRLTLTVAAEESFKPSFANSVLATAVIITLIILAFFTATAFDSLLLILYLLLILLFYFPFPNLLVCSKNNIQIFIIIFG